MESSGYEEVHYTVPVAIGNVEDENDKDPSIPAIAPTDLVPFIELSHDMEAQQKQDLERAEYISASILKKDGDCDICMEVGMNGVLRISEISVTSNLFDSPICPGDEVVRINETNCQYQGPEFAFRLIRQSPGHTVTILVRTQGDGNPGLVWSYAMLPQDPSNLGVSLAGGNGEILVKEIDPEGLFAHSALCVGDRVLSINMDDCCDDDMTHYVALNLLKTAEKTIRIVSERRICPASRPHLISVTVCKDSSSLEDIGLEAKCLADGKVRVSRLVPFGAFGQSPMMVGDEIVSINTVAVDSRGFEPDFMRKPETVTVIARVDNGDPSVVAAAVTKQSDHVLGVTLGKRHGNTLFVRAIASDSLLMHSLLNVGDRLLSINGHDCSMMTNDEIGTTIKKSEWVVTFLGKTSPDSAIVLSASVEDEEENLLSPCVLEDDVSSIDVELQYLPQSEASLRQELDLVEHRFLQQQNVGEPTATVRERILCCKWCTILRNHPRFISLGFVVLWVIFMAGIGFGLGASN